MYGPTIIFNNWYSSEKSGWHELTIRRQEPSLVEYQEWYCGIADWIMNNVDGAWKHSRWKIEQDHVIFRFRYERDYIRFVLRWT